MTLSLAESEWELIGELSNEFPDESRYPYTIGETLFNLIKVHATFTGEFGKAGYVIQDCNDIRIGEYYLLFNKPKLIVIPNFQQPSQIRFTPQYWSVEFTLKVWEYKRMALVDEVPGLLASGAFR